MDKHRYGVSRCITRDVHRSTIKVRRLERRRPGEVSASAKRVTIDQRFERLFHLSEALVAVVIEEARGVHILVAASGRLARIYPAGADLMHRMTVGIFLILPCLVMATTSAGSSGVIGRGTEDSIEGAGRNIMRTAEGGLVAAFATLGGTKSSLVFSRPVDNGRRGATSCSAEWRQRHAGRGRFQLQRIIYCIH